MTRTTGPAIVLRALAILTSALALAGCGGTSGSSTSVAQSVAENPPASPDITSSDTVHLSASSFSIAQSAASVTITVSRTSAAATPITIDYDTADGTAVAGTDYTGTSGTLQWAENDATDKSISIPVNAATAFSGSKSFDIVLSNPSANATLGSPGSASIAISGAASPGVGTLDVADPTLTVQQSAKTLTVSVNRSGGDVGATTVAYATADGTAVAGTDYTKTLGVLNWADGDSAAKSFSVPISNAKPFSGNKTFQVGLSNATSGAMIGSADATVTILGSSSAAVGTLQLSAANYSAAQTSGSLKITVNRIGGSNGAASVTYSTKNGTAVAGTDFTAANGTLKWTDGDTAAKTFSVTISNATLFTGSKTFSVSLSSPSAGATVSSPATATVAISGSGSAPVGSLQLTASSYAVSQGAGTLAVSVSRTGGSNGATSISYSTTNGTAVAGTDFTGASGTLQWANGETANKSFSIPISSATAFSGSRSFTVKLSNPTNGAALGSPSQALTTITGGASTSAPPGSTFWVYYNGTFNWGGDYSFVATANYNDKSGVPLSGSYDIAVTVTGAYGGFLPFAGGTVPLWNFDASPYSYLIFAFKPTVANQAAQVFFVKVGDIPVGVVVDPFNGQYGPKPQAGVWGTYRIPLSDLGVKGTSVYKFAIQDQTGLGHNVFYVDNIGFN
jgi:hypothetical protein